jgi:tRNA dimethylallyltransferase
MRSSAASVAADDGRTVVRAICGPTAAGKSAIALRLAERFGLAIVAADSRQVYRDFDIGTAKPTASERRRVPHFGIDVAEPTERYSAARWADAFDAWAAQARAAGREPLVVGGTGLYLRALAEPLFAEPPLDASRRQALAAALDTMDTPTLRRWVAALDPERAHLGRTQLLRAIEVAVLTGTRVSALHAAAARDARFRVCHLVVDPGRDVLRARIAARTDAMLDAGWVDEVRALAGSIGADAPAWKSTGYDILRRHVLGELTLDEARERIVIDTRQYAKRQRTWFRHQLADADVVRVDPDAPNADAVATAWWLGDLRSETNP